MKFGSLSLTVGTGRNFPEHYIHRANLSHCRYSLATFNPRVSELKKKKFLFTISSSSMILSHSFSLLAPTPLSIMNQESSFSSPFPLLFTTLLWGQSVWNGNRVIKIFVLRWSKVFDSAGRKSVLFGSTKPPTLEWEASTFPVRVFGGKASYRAGI